MKMHRDQETRLYSEVHSSFIINPEGECRMLKEIAKRWLLSNDSIIIRGHVRYLQIKDMGLGVCVARLRPFGFQNTFMVKQWEK